MFFLGALGAWSWTGSGRAKHILSFAKGRAPRAAPRIGPAPADPPDTGNRPAIMPAGSLCFRYQRDPKANRAETPNSRGATRPGVPGLPSAI